MSISNTSILFLCVINVHNISKNLPTVFNLSEAVITLYSDDNCFESVSMLVGVRPCISNLLPKYNIILTIYVACMNLQVCRDFCLNNVILNMRFLYVWEGHKTVVHQGSQNGISVRTQGDEVKNT